jgi:hypothetical protein
MKNTKLLAAALFCLVSIGALLFAINGWSRTTADQMNENARWRICYGCGYMWRMDSKDIVEQKKNDPTHQGWVQCPQCKAWKGVQVRKCNRCGKPIPQVIEVRTEAGAISYLKRHYCDECAEQLGIAPSDEIQAEPETDE